MGGIPICFDHTNGLYLAIDYSVGNAYTLVSYKASNNTKSTIANITNYLSQAAVNASPVNLFFSNGSLYVLATLSDFDIFGVMKFQYSGSNVTYSGYVPLSTTNSDPVSVVQINFIKDGY